MESEESEESPTGKKWVNPDTGAVLYPLSGKGNKASDDIRAKLKGSASPRRRLSKQIWGLQKKKELGKPVEDDLLQLISNPELSLMQIHLLLQEIIQTDISDKTKLKCVDLLIKTHAVTFGTKTLNKNINLDFTEQLRLFREAREEMMEREINLTLERVRGTNNHEGTFNPNDKDSGGSSGSLSMGTLSIKSTEESSELSEEEEDESKE